MGSETGKSIYVNAGDMILVRMNENPGTGYRWQLVTDDKDGFDQTLCQLQATSGFTDGLYEPSTSTDGSDDKVVDGVARPYVPPGAGEWPYPYPWGDRRSDVRCTVAGSTVLKLRYKRSWEERYSWESRLNVYVLPITRCAADAPESVPRPSRATWCGVSCRNRSGGFRLKAAKAEWGRRRCGRKERTVAHDTKHCEDVGEVCRGGVASLCSLWRGAPCRD